MGYKFILDTNVLQDDSIKRLEQGGLIEASNSGRFAFYVTPVLLIERLHFYLKGKLPRRLLEH